MCKMRTQIDCLDAYWNAYHDSSSQREEWEQEINALIWKRYNLIPTEIRIIEGAGESPRNFPGAWGKHTVILKKNGCQPLDRSICRVRYIAVACRACMNTKVNMRQWKAGSVGW
jgi:hypothetical protein